jgi:hypothetical protein
VDASNRIELRDVTLGIETPEDVELTSGVKAGDLVAVGDRSNLQPGETVCPKVVQLIRYRSEEP